MSDGLLLSVVSCFLVFPYFFQHILHYVTMTPAQIKTRRYSPVVTDPPHDNLYQLQNPPFCRPPTQKVQIIDMNHYHSKNMLFTLKHQNKTRYLYWTIIQYQTIVHFWHFKHKYGQIQVLKKLINFPAFVYTNLSLFTYKHPKRW